MPCHAASYFTFWSQGSRENFSSLWDMLNLDILPGQLPDKEDRKNLQRHQAAVLAYIVFQLQCGNSSISSLLQLYKRVDNGGNGSQTPSKAVQLWQFTWGYRLYFPLHQAENDQPPSQFTPCAICPGGSTFQSAYIFIEAALGTPAIAGGSLWSTASIESWISWISWISLMRCSRSMDQAGNAATIQEDSVACWKSVATAANTTRVSANAVQNKSYRDKTWQNQFLAKAWPWTKTGHPRYHVRCNKSMWILVFSWQPVFTRKWQVVTTGSWSVWCLYSARALRPFVGGCLRPKLRNVSPSKQQTASLFAPCGYQRRERMSLPNPTDMFTTSLLEVYYVNAYSGHLI